MGFKKADDALAGCGGCLTPCAYMAFLDVCGQLVEEVDAEDWERLEQFCNLCLVDSDDATRGVCYIAMTEAWVDAKQALGLEYCWVVGFLYDGIGMVGGMSVYLYLSLDEEEELRAGSVVSGKSFSRIKLMES